MKNILMLIGVSVCLIAACSSENTQSQKVEETFPIVFPALIDTIFTKEYVADIQSIQNVELRSKTKGIIDKIWVDEGKTVAANQIIYTINSARNQVELRKAESQIKTILAEKKMLEIELENTKKLVQKNIISKSEQAIVEAKIGTNTAQIDEIKAEIEGIKLQMAYSQIKAPYSGVLNRHLLKVGSLVEEGTALTTISNNNEVYAYFKVSEKEYLDFMSKKKSSNLEKVDLELANGEAFPFKGTIETIESEFDKETGNIAFRARFANPTKLLRHGSSGKISLNQTLKGAIIIPQKSTFEVQDKIYVYKVNDKGVVEQKSITPVVRLDNFYIIEGLELKDKIIFEGLQNVKAGEKIKTKIVNFR
jgi:membrane fusion protein (multidrug efflux system)